jgi:hypothetical protein
MMPGSIPNISRQNHRQTLRTDEKNPTHGRRRRQEAETKNIEREISGGP